MKVKRKKLQTTANSELFGASGFFDQLDRGH